jgi:hypothetical protein
MLLIHTLLQITTTTTTAAAATAATVMIYGFIDVITLPIIQIMWRGMAG